MRTFEEIFETTAQVQSRAPGRVNLLGEHTDYNDGFVLPTAIPQQTYVQIALSSDSEHHFYSSELEEIMSCQVNASECTDFGGYIFGCIRRVEESGFSVPALLVHVHSEVPIGVGLSSSAALEVAVLRALRELLKLPIDDVRIAQLAQEAEIMYAHVRCGIMDQMASSLAQQGMMLFLDTRTLERKLVPLPESTELIVLDTGAPRSLADSAYNTRREECEEAARLLGVAALRDVTTLSALDILPETLKRRARHVVTENIRVLEAAAGVNAKRFGELMNASHLSLRDDFEVSIAALDEMASLLQSHPKIFGARLTGAGFGGACVALAAAGYAAAAAKDVIKEYNAGQAHGQILVPQILDKSHYKEKI